MTMIKGVDVSSHNGKIDWKKVKESRKVDFALLRMGYGKENLKQIDTTFEYNYQQCKNNNIPVGAYHYSYAYTPEAAKIEADFALKLLKGKQFEFPIFYDIEEPKHTNLSKIICTDIVTEFCEKLELNGYWAGVYSFDSFFYSNLNKNIPLRFSTWVARTPKNDNGIEIINPSNVEQDNISIHQYSFKGTMPGIRGDVDLNVCYKDFPTLIKMAKKNGFTSSENNKVYSVSAFKNNLTKENATELSEKLKSFDMNTSIIMQKEI